MAKYIERFTHLLYTKTKDKKNNGAHKFLNDLRHKSEQDDSEVDIASSNEMDENKIKAKTIDVKEISIHSFPDIFTHELCYGDIDNIFFLLGSEQQSEFNPRAIRLALKSKYCQGVYEIVLDKCYELNSVEESESENEYEGDQEEKEDDGCALFRRIIFVESLNVSKLFPDVNDRKYFMGLYHLFVQHPDIGFECLTIIHFLRTYGENFRSAENMDKDRFFKSVFEHIEKFKNKGISMCYETVYDTMLKTGYELNFSEDYDIVKCVKRSL